MWIDNQEGRTGLLFDILEVRLFLNKAPNNGHTWLLFSGAVPEGRSIKLKREPLGIQQTLKYHEYAHVAEYLQRVTGRSKRTAKPYSPSASSIDRYCEVMGS
jgi:hypothetical protein